MRTIRAEKLWFHGRLIQLAARAMCTIWGHPWTRWRWEWDEEGWTEMDDMGRPPPGVMLTWFRGCERDCGTIQVAHARYDQKEQLPS